MKNNPIIYLLILTLTALAACEKDGPALLSGDIAGTVNVYDENYYLLKDMSGIRISLTDGSFQSETTSDALGSFLFQDIDYGNYQIDLIKEGYIKSFLDYTLNHLGGYSPTMPSYWIHEIPKFETHIDSLLFNLEYNRSYIYVSLQKLSGLPKIGYNFWCYFSNTSEVSKDNYVARAIGWMNSPNIGGLLSEIHFEMWDPNFDELKPDSVYMCVYPRAWGRGTFYYDHYTGSLGKASNVFSFRVE